MRSEKLHVPHGWGRLPSGAVIVNGTNGNDNITVSGSGPWRT